MKKILLTSVKPEYMIMLLRTIAFIMLIIMIDMLYNNWEYNYIILVGIGVLISALLLSYSGFLNLDTSNEKYIEIQNQLYRALIYELQTISNLFELSKSYQKNEETHFDDVMVLSNILESIEQKVKAINIKDMVTILDDNLLEKLQNLFTKLIDNNMKMKLVTLSLSDGDNIQSVLDDIKIEDLIVEINELIFALKDSNN